MPQELAAGFAPRTELQVGYMRLRCDELLGVGARDVPKGQRRGEWQNVPQIYRYCRCWTSQPSPATPLVCENKQRGLVNGMMT